MKTSLVGRWVLPWLVLFNAASARAVEPITPQEANELDAADKGAIIDVREMSEVKATGIAKPAAWLPKSEIDAESDLYKALVKTWDKKKPLIFYCRTGNRSALVAQKLDKLGFTTRNMGSLDGWKKAGLPVVPWEQRR